MIRKLADWSNKPITIRKANGWAAFIWLLLVLPTVTLWKTSILWVAFLSIWANFISHYTAWMAARVEVRAEDVQDKMDETVTLSHIEQLEEKILTAMAPN